MFKNLFAILLIGLFSPNLGFAAPAVLIEENSKPIETQTITVDGQVVKSKKAPSGWQNREQPLAEGKSLTELYTGQEFSTALEMRARRRVGVGLATSGQLGLAGVLIELNFAATDSFIAGFGGGPKFNSIAFEWKHVFGGKAISPYTTLGYAHWYNSNPKNGKLEKTTPEILGTRFLTSEEKQTGLFAKDFFIPSVGLQYNQLVGPYVGTSFFAEVVLLIEASDLNPVPTGAVGALYYF
jgi:hypothetical protein